MGKLGRTLFVILLVTMWLVSPVSTGYAQTPTTQPEAGAPVGDGVQPAATPAPLVVAQPTPIPLPLPEDIDSVETIPFQWMGLAEQTLTGPFDAATYTMGLPAHWELVEGTQLELNIFHALSSLKTQLTGLAPDAFLGTLDVFFNDKLITTVPLDWIGERQVIIPIPQDALAPAAPGEPHTLLIILNADYECLPGWYSEEGLHTTVAIRDTSSLIAPHRMVEPSTDLRLLPFPISQDSFLPDTAVLVVPDSPTAQELQGALAVAAGFGQMTNGRLNISLAPASQLTPEMQQSRHVILVGKVDALPMAGEAAWAVGPTAADFAKLGANAADGVVQMAVSPWAASKVVLLVTGTTDEGVAKAGQAVSAGSILVAGQPNVAVVTDVLPQVSAPDTLLVDHTLADLGYQYVEMNGIGYVAAQFRFDVKPGLEATDDAYFELHYNHSGFMDFGNSGLALRVNDQSIGSAEFDPTSRAIQTAKFTIPRSAIRQGRNTLSMEAFLLPFAICAPYNLNGLWVTIQPESLLHLPLQPAEAQSVTFFDLGVYPQPFVSSPILLGDTAFVVPAGDPTSWDVAAQMAFSLGQQANKVLADLVVAFGDAVPEDVKQDRHLIVIGRPSQLPILNEMAETLPVPFEPGSDMPMPQNDLRIDYFIAPDSSIGYLELAAAPWNETREVLVVLGNNDLGVHWAGNALMTPQLRGRLGGNVAVVSEEQVVSSYFPPSGVMAQAEATPAAEAEAGATGVTGAPTPVPPTSIAGRPNWAIPVLVVTTGLMVLLIVGLVIAASRRR